MNLDDFYPAYGETLATRLLNHTNEARHFVYLDTDDMRPLTEGVKDPDRVTPGPLLVWEQFGDRLQTSGRDNYHLRMSGSLAVLIPCENTTLAKRLATRQARAHCLRALAQMRLDALEGSLETAGVRVELDGEEGESTGMLIPGWAGYGWGFTWMVPLELTV